MGTEIKKEIVRTVMQMCPCCLEKHPLEIVRVLEHGTFQDCVVEYEAEYTHCDRTDEWYTDEAQMTQNDVNIKTAYRKAKGGISFSE